nr:hypothetical protein DD237_004001 [Ipomoea batatas]
MCFLQMQGNKLSIPNPFCVFSLQCECECAAEAEAEARREKEKQANELLCVRYVGIHTHCVEHGVTQTLKPTFFFVSHQSLLHMMLSISGSGWSFSIKSSLGLTNVYSIISNLRQQARLAQSVERKALNLVVVGSSPTVGVCFLPLSFLLPSRVSLLLY